MPAGPLCVWSLSPMTEALTLIRHELSAAARPCVTSSFQADGVVLLHMLRQVEPDVPVLFLDTVHHFAETLAYRDALRERWRLNVITLRAEQPAPGLWRTSTDLCCARHKVDPLFAALTGYDVWFTGLRRDQSRTRASLGHIDRVQLPSGHQLRKVNPLADWTWDQVREYARAHDIPLLPLYDRGYLSIGCEPCTAVPLDPSNPRAGRWSGEKLECGIHTHS